MLSLGFPPQEVAHRLQLEKGVERSRAELLVEVALLQHELLKPFALRPELVSLYVNIPFCPSRCAYCSFVSNSSDHYREAERKLYMDGLMREIQNYDTLMREHSLKLTTVYIGGGTPTVLSPSQLQELLSAIGELPTWERELEVTVEAGRPDTIDQARLTGIPSTTRISINPQTMNDTTLELIGRRHSVEQVKQSTTLARSMGFKNINMDLIIGLPNEGSLRVADSLSQVLELNPDSVTIHMFSPKRASRFTAGDAWEVMSSEDATVASNACSEVLRKAGMRPYYLYRQRGILAGLENIGWSRPDKECLYNILVIGESHTILGLGAGASSLFPLRDSEWDRHQNPKEPKMYLNRLEQIMSDKRVLLEKWRSKV